MKSKGDRARVTEYLQELEIKDGDRVLETSIGTGRNIQYLPRTASYYGIDISWGMLKQCQKKGRRQNWDLELFLCPAEGLCFQDNVFDVVYHVGGINVMVLSRPSTSDFSYARYQPQSLLTAVFPHLGLVQGQSPAERQGILLSVPYPYPG